MGNNSPDKRENRMTYHPEQHTQDVNNREIYVRIIWSLLMKMKVPNEEAEEIVEKVRGGQGMGYLFENMDEMDIQAERRNTRREKERADAAEERADAAEERADVEKERADAAEEQADAEKKRADKAERELERLRQEISRLKSESGNKQ